MTQSADRSRNSQTGRPTLTPHGYPIGLCCAAAVGALSLVASVGAARASPALPEHLTASDHGPPAARGWTFADVIEVTRITSVAISADGARWAFVVKQPSLALGESRYGFYVGSGHGRAHKLVEAPFLADLQARPGHNTWTLRGAFGDGVQVYEIDDTGHRTTRLAHYPLAPAGGDVSLAPSASEPTRATGVLAYGWSPDGGALWYAALRPRSASNHRAWRDEGLTYVDGQTTPADFYAEPSAEAVELWVHAVKSGRDQIVAQTAGDRTTASMAFQGGAVAWEDPHRLVYRRQNLSETGASTQSPWRYDLRTGAVTALSADAASERLSGVPTAHGRLLLTRTEGGQYELSEVSRQGPGRAIVGRVTYSAMGGGLGDWRNRKGEVLYGVRRADRFGLAAYPQATPLSQVSQSLRSCAFAAEFRLGVCSRESLTAAPELVEVHPVTGAVRVLARPNSRYDVIMPLHSDPATWTNRFGTVSSGYITYPRRYQSHRRYPAIVITHAADARNLFAAETFQWAFPLQVLAERGYVVLSVNETTQDLAVSDAYGSARSDLPTARMQQAMGLDAVATMEAAVEDAVTRGLVDPKRVGIAGYSRGGIVTTLALSQSKVFRTGINADTAFFSAGGFFRGGMVREIYRGLFGGSPLDARYVAAYRAFSPSARADQFSGPLLQMFTGRSAATALELDQALRAAKVRTKLVVYPGETHILHRPRTILAAMQVSLAWFEAELAAEPDPARPPAAVIPMP